MYTRLVCRYKRDDVSIALKVPLFFKNDIACDKVELKT